MIRIVALSDTHGLHREMTVPEGDVLIHAGDFMSSGTDPMEVIDFNSWLGDQPHVFRVVVPGNHDCLFEGRDASLARGLLTNATHYLENYPAEIAGLNFYGSPQTPEFMNWAFNVQRGAPIRRYWDMIPARTDVLIVHGPPYMILDQIAGEPDHLGCPELLRAVERVRPRTMIFGHIHTSHGVAEHGGVQFYNVAVMNEFGVKITQDEHGNEKKTYIPRRVLHPVATVIDLEV